MIEYLCSKKKYYISPDAYTEEQRKTFGISDEAPAPEQVLKLINVRYAMGLIGYKR